MDMGKVGVKGGLGLGVWCIPTEIQGYIQTIRINIRLKIASNVRREAWIL